MNLLQHDTAASAIIRVVNPGRFHQDPDPFFKNPVPNPTFKKKKSGPAPTLFLYKIIPFPFFDLKV